MENLSREQLECLEKEIHRRKANTKVHIQYTDVIVIGNGPSGICLSYMLSGNLPHYNGLTHPDEYLQMRLEKEPNNSIIEQDLEFLSDGLEGRSSNPVGLLFDTLTHPAADLGMESESLLEWKLHKEEAVPHVVLGKRAPGGVWQMLDGDMQTISLGNWMELPGMSFKEWRRKHKREHFKKKGKNSRKCCGERGLIKDVRNYYVDYVNENNLAANFHNYTTVTSVERVLDVPHSIDSESGEQIPCSGNHCGKCKWEVRGYCLKEDECGEIVCEDFCYRAPNVVLATGTHDAPNKLHAPGENFPYVEHSVRDLETLVNSGEVAPNRDPLVVIGAGLSAADAILAAEENGIPIVHIFRTDVQDPAIIYRTLPKTLYPEYHHIHNLMNETETQDGYKAFSMHSVTEFTEDKKVIIHDHNTKLETIVQASKVLVQIGSNPRLSFMPQGGKNLGVVRDMNIQPKHNPIAVDQYTYQSTYASGLYAMGPLVGDNFVRFLQGGALGIVSHLWRKRHPECM